MQILKNIKLSVATFLILLISLSIYAKEDFSQGVAALEAKDWVRAEQYFHRVLSVNPNSSEAYYNLGLTKMRQGQNGWALGYLYKALDIQPGFTPAKEAVFELKDKLAIEKFSGFFGALHSQLLSQVSYDFLWLILLASVAFTLFYWIKFLKKRQVALAQELSLPQLRFTHFFFPIITFLLFLVVALQTYDRSNSKAVVITANAAVFSAPFEESTKTPLFNLSEGALLEILKEQDEFYQVRSVRQGAGWIRKDQIFVFSNEIL